MVLTEILPHAAALFPNRTAMVCGENRCTYRELADRVARLAAGLGNAGISRGDRLAVLHPNCHRMLELYFAAAHLGAILVPLNYRLTASDLAYILDDTGSRALVAHSRWSDLAAETVDRASVACELIWSNHHDTASGIDYEQLLDQQQPTPLPRPELSADHPAQIYYTSGTTGHQKGVVLTHRNVGSHALATITDLGLSSTDVWIHAAPMFHLADAWATWAITRVGGRHVMLPHFEAANFVDLVLREGVTVSNLVPTMLNDVVYHAAAEGLSASQFRLVMSGGAPISPTLVARVAEVFGCDYVQTYGLTETSPYLTFSLLSEKLLTLPEDQQMQYRAKTGRPAVGVELRLVDEAGTDVPADGRSVGEIVARGQRITPGYWKLPEATAEAFRDGWFHTGDLATLDGEGFFNIVDRAKDVILSGGEQIYSTEVEHVLSQHPAVREAAVVGMPHERLGETVHAVVVLIEAKSTDDEALIEHCRQHLAHFKCPRSMAFTDALPRTGSGKINKRPLREPT